ncbi:stress responsive A/B Barrel domain protein [Hydrogenophaga sp. RAC07]|uniref:Dabb family protein n=1 Tax=Hydrogenophaga sp. RAC07 TaxID=1842537 RepID=UPI00083CD580|nr:Dabb family protein [Hydrogenophaga sp. RAC07]AOF87727.1 stress responsive A/B Barrel domain protein [Hydrogenophaga sp. RAC07]
MLHHIVMWKIKDLGTEGDKASNVAQAKALLDACAQLVPGIERFDVATAQPGLESTYDLVLNSTFTDRAALAAYQTHPSHVALKPFMRRVVLERQCMDYET